MAHLINVQSLVDIDGEPRVLDLELAAHLGMGDIHDIRRTIECNREELEMHGGISGHYPEIRKGRGRPGKAYYLNEGQALVICALSRTCRAAHIRKTLIDVFMAYRQGKLVHVKEHHRRPPTPREVDSDFQEMRRQLLRFKNHPTALIDVLARCVIRLDALEAD